MNIITNDDGIESYTREAVHSEAGKDVCVSCFLFSVVKC